MIKNWIKMDQQTMSWTGIGLIMATFVGVTVVGDRLFSSVNLDLTEDKIFTLSDGTEEVLGAIDEPITLRLYRSEALQDLGPVYANHAKRVDNLLGEFERLSGGKLEIERYDPEPYSPEEDLAVADGLQGVPYAADGSQLYFGLTGVNSTDDLKTLPFLSPDRGNFLEYDLTRLVYDLANPEKKKVALIGDFPLAGSPMTGYQPSVTMDAMRQFFDIEQKGGSIDKIEDDVEVVMLAQPNSLDETSLYAIDQFVMRGGKVLAFVDPHAETMSGNPQQPQPQGNAIETLEPLLASWGVEIPSESFVGDLAAATRVQARHDGRQVLVDYLAWLGMPKDGFASEDVITANLKQVNVRSAGSIKLRDGAEMTIEPLISTSPQAAEIDVAKVQLMPDPVGIWEGFEPAGESFTLAARVSGKVKSAFPDGPPEAIEDEAIKEAHLAEAEAPLNLILVADADLLADDAWVRTQNLLGQDLSVPLANNGDFAVNALDNLSGSEGLIALRGRGLTVRPFDRLDAMAKEAELALRGKEQELITKIDETKQKIADLQEGDGEAGFILTGAQQQTIDDFRTEMLDLRRELRDVQFGLRKDVDQLESWLKALNIWTVPGLLALFAIGLTLWRRFGPALMRRPAAA